MHSMHRCCLAGRLRQSVHRVSQMTAQQAPRAIIANTDTFMRKIVYVVCQSARSGYNCKTDPSQTGEIVGDFVFEMLRPLPSDHTSTKATYHQIHAWAPVIHDYASNKVALTVFLTETAWLTCSIWALALSSTESGSCGAAESPRLAMDRCTRLCSMALFSSLMRCLLSVTWHPDSHAQSCTA